MLRGADRHHLIAAAMATLGLGVGGVAIAISEAAPSFSRAATSPTNLALFGASGFALLGIGVLALLRTPRPDGALFICACAIGWFLGEWPNPGAAVAPVFSLGLVFGSAWPALLAHAVTAETGTWTTASRAIIAAAYGTNLGLLGLLPTVAFDPVASRCPMCPDNLLGLLADPGFVVNSTRAGLAFVMLWVVAIGFMWASALRARARRRRLWVVAPATVVVGAIGVDAAHSLARGFVSNDRTDLILWTIQAWALIGVAAGIAFGWVRARQIRQKVTRVALDLSSAPKPGELGRLLQQILGDQHLQVTYPIENGRSIDVDGRDVEPGRAGATVTTVTRAGRPVAQIVHGRGNVDEARTAEAVAAARLALETERLQAVSRRQMRELRASRIRIVMTADDERRRLERDLHDGAQQRLVGLAMEVAVELEQQSRRAARGDGRDARLSAAESELRAALAELRDLAHGIYPRALRDEGIAAALEDFADSARIPVSVVELPSGRVDRTAETVAYRVVADAIGRSTFRAATVRASCSDDSLIVDITGQGDPLPDPVLVELEDRVGSLAGTIEMTSATKGRVQVHVEIPCAS